MTEATPQPNDSTLAAQALARKFEIDAEVAKIQGRHKAELEPLVEEQKLCEVFVKDFMNSAGMQQFKIVTGDQAYFQEGARCGVSDFDAALDFIVAAPVPEGLGYTEEGWAAALHYIRAHGNWQFLNKALNKTAVKEFIDVHQVPPPGAKWDTYRELQWRRGKG